MRLFATSRALRISHARWSIASRPRQSLSVYASYTNRRHWSSTPRRRTADPATASTPTDASALKPLTIQGKPYRTDQWTNASDSILAHVGRGLYLDENHPLTITRRLIEHQFPKPVYGNYVEKDPVVSTALNFDVLGFPADHPGRSRTDTYYINDATVLRTHTSAHQQAYFQQIGKNKDTRDKESGYTVVADVYRRDAIDRSHYPVFHQMEGARLWKRIRSNSSDSGDQYAETAKAITEDLNALPEHGVVVDGPSSAVNDNNPLQSQHTASEVDAASAHLKRTLELMVINIFTSAGKAANIPLEESLKELKIRWVETYFPFTSPSWELEVFWQGDWLEILGCGIIKQELLGKSDVPDQIGWAFGLGLERIAMLLFNIPDIRLFWSHDERFLSQFRQDTVSCFEPFSKYPGCYKDVAFWLPAESVHENDVMEIVRDVAGDLVEDVKLIDEFTHPKSKRRSMCYRINYRSLERTLTNEEANDLHGSVGGRLVELFGVELR